MLFNVIFFQRRALYTVLIVKVISYETSKLHDLWHCRLILLDPASTLLSIDQV